jgi:hypothetical protein
VISMIHRGLSITGGVLLILLLGGCVSIPALTRARNLDREIQLDRLRFYEKISDAYFILGYEYYALAKQAEDEIQPERAREHATKATMYNIFYREMREAAEQLRAELERGSRTPPEEPSVPVALSLENPESK